MELIQRIKTDAEASYYLESIAAGKERGGGHGAAIE